MMLVLTFKNYKRKSKKTKGDCMLIKVYSFDETTKIDNIKELISKNMYYAKPIVDNEHIIGIVDTKKTYVCNDGLYVNASLYGISKEDFQKEYEYEGAIYGGVYINSRERIARIFDVKRIKYLRKNNE